jgi:hypothetical protein
MESLLDSIRKDIDAAIGAHARAQNNYTRARKELFASEQVLETLRLAEINLEHELERIQHEIRTTRIYL